MCLTVPSNLAFIPKIAVLGVGGAGGNAVNNMVRRKLSGVHFIVANTDAQALENSQADKKIQLGPELTRGLGAGSVPEIGKEAAKESVDEIKESIKDMDMIFIASGMGGGTGTGATDFISELAMQNNVLSVAIVTTPFDFEGVKRAKVAWAGIESLSKCVDSYMIIPNQNLFKLSNEATTFSSAFEIADEVLYSSVKGITDLILSSGLINLDFADIKSVFYGKGRAVMGTGEASGDGRAIKAAEQSIVNPLLEEMSIRESKDVLISITGDLGMTLFEVDSAITRIRSEINEYANVIFGSTFSNEMDGAIRVSVFATGINVDKNKSVKKDSAEESEEQEGDIELLRNTSSAIRDTIKSYDSEEANKKRTGIFASLLRKKIKSS